MALGGNAPVIVCADDDPEPPGKIAVAGKIPPNAGQVCVSPSRLCTTKSIWPQFTGLCRHTRRRV